MTYHSNQKKKLEDVIWTLKGKQSNPCMTRKSAREIMDEYCSKPQLICRDNIEDYKDSQCKSNIDLAFCGLWEAYKIQEEEIFNLKGEIVKLKRMQKKVVETSNLLRDRLYYHERKSSDIQE